MKNPKLILAAIGMVLSALAAFGVISPTALAGIQDPLTRIVEAALVIAGQLAILMAAWKQVPATKPEPKPQEPVNPGQPELF